jgi:hybrid cluster-associated redox disulfide protein
MARPSDGPDTPLTPDDIVAALLARRPDRVRVFLDRRMACPGCPMAGHATLADVAAIYGLDVRELIAALESQAAR